MRGALQCRRLVPKMKASDNLGHCWLRRQWYCTASQPPALVLGAAQLVATHDFSTNVDRIVECIVAAGHDGIDLLAFAEAATTGESAATHYIQSSDTHTGAHRTSALACATITTDAVWPGYFSEAIAATTPGEIVAAEAKIAQACAAAGVATVVGTPYYSTVDGRCFNSATVIDRTGQVVGRQHKLQLVPTDDWATAGEEMNVRSLQNKRKRFIWTSLQG